MTIRVTIKHTEPDNERSVSVIQLDNGTPRIRYVMKPGEEYDVCVHTGTSFEVLEAEEGAVTNYDLTKEVPCVSCGDQGELPLGDVIISGDSLSPETVGALKETLKAGVDHLDAVGIAEQEGAKLGKACVTESLPTPVGDGYATGGIIPKGTPHIIGVDPATLPDVTTYTSVEIDDNDEIIHTPVTLEEVEAIPSVDLDKGN